MEEGEERRLLRSGNSKEDNGSQRVRESPAVKEMEKLQKLVGLAVYVSNMEKQYGLQLPMSFIGMVERFDPVTYKFEVRSVDPNPVYGPLEPLMKQSGAEGDSVSAHYHERVEFRMAKADDFRLLVSPKDIRRMSRKDATARNQRIADYPPREVPVGPNHQVDLASIEDQK